MGVLVCVCVCFCLSSCYETVGLGLGLGLLMEDHWSFLLVIVVESETIERREVCQIIHCCFARDLSR